MIIIRLDEEAEASGFTSTMQGELEGFITLEELAKVDLEGDGIDVLSDDDDEDVETEAAADGEGGAADSAKAPPLPGTDSWVPLARVEGGVEEGGEKEEEEEEIDGVRQKYHRAKKVVGGLGDGFCGTFFENHSFFSCMYDELNCGEFSHTMKIFSCVL